MLIIELWSFLFPNYSIDNSLVIKEKPKDIKPTSDLKKKNNSFKINFTNLFNKMNAQDKYLVKENPNPDKSNYKDHGKWYLKEGKWTSNDIDLS